LFRKREEGAEHTSLKERGEGNSRKLQVRGEGRGRQQSREAIHAIKGKGKEIRKYLLRWEEL